MLGQEYSTPLLPQLICVHQHLLAILRVDHARPAIKEYVNHRMSEVLAIRIIRAKNATVLVNAYKRQVHVAKILQIVRSAMTV